MRSPEMDVLEAVGGDLVAGGTPERDVDDPVVRIADGRAGNLLTGGRIVAPLLVHEAGSDG